MSPLAAAISSPLRIVSLIPSATEIVAALGLADSLVGRSHECDYPLAVQQLPICTAPKFNPAGSSAQINDRVTDLLQSALSVYEVKTELLEQLQPTHILTQAQCDVCAVNLADVEQAVATLTHSHPQVISLQPDTLGDVWGDIQRVAEALQVSDRGQQLLANLQGRVQACQEKSQTLVKPTVACIEWTDPLMAAANWIPELVTLAGGTALFGSVGQHSPWLSWDALSSANPDVLIFMPCGFDLSRTKQEVLPLTDRQEWADLRSVQTGQVYFTDGNQYFNRPGPRLVDSLEILAEILHPEVFRFGYEETGWEQLSIAVQMY